MGKAATWTGFICIVHLEGAKRARTSLSSTLRITDSLHCMVGTHEPCCTCISLAPARFPIYLPSLEAVLAESLGAGWFLLPVDADTKTRMVPGIVALDNLPRNSLNDSVVCHLQVIKHVEGGSLYPVALQVDLAFKCTYGVKALDWKLHAYRHQLLIDCTGIASLTVATSEYHFAMDVPKACSKKAIKVVSKHSDMHLNNQC